LITRPGAGELVPMRGELAARAGVHTLYAVFSVAGLVLESVTV
jgi:hypothetical protein